ncbi:hypothetical protein [uncultured Ruminococcus sp.]|uniref:hypothetical protein n=1 Tax=uncultured Ruminococcus sp. TaxID=165186 RepID=UPI0025CC5F52|nr:hypothetical protein [uncultured Ruminococcus sp.]
MDNFMKAMKMYIRTAVRPITLVFGLGVPISMIAAMVADPAKQGEKDYGSMIACMGMMHAILLILFFIGNISISQMKFFGSLPQAKVLFTDVPIAAMGTVCLVFDIVTFACAYIRCGSGMAADLLIVDAANTITACFLNATMSKKIGKIYAVLSALIFVSFFNQMIILTRFSFINKGFGVTVPVAALIALAVYIVGFAAIHFFMQWWWKKSGRNYNNSYNLIAQNTTAGNA